MQRNEKKLKNSFGHEKTKKHPAGCFFVRGSVGGFILYLILCEQQEDLKHSLMRVKSIKNRFFRGR